MGVMKECLKYYEMPLKDCFPYIFCNDGSIAFNWMVHLDSEKRKDIIQKINGELTVLKFKQNVFFRDGYISCINGKGDIQPLLLVRGWGKLIGGGGYRLSPEKAAQIQDEFAEYIVEQLNK